MSFNFYEYLLTQRKWSEKTFGPAKRTNGIIEHIRKELKEIEENPHLEEWIDVVILALDGAWRTGASPAEIIGCLKDKTSKNHERKWPDWRTLTEDDAIEHIKQGETNG